MTQANQLLSQIKEQLETLRTRIAIGENDSQRAVLASLDEIEDQITDYFAQMVNAEERL